MVSYYQWVALAILLCTVNLKTGTISECQRLYNTTTWYSQYHHHFSAFSAYTPLF